MKFLHLSDLHLGKRVNEFSMLEDQEYILTKIINIIDEQKIEGVWMAGDIYDKAVPPAEAVRLLDYFLNRLAERKLPVFIISGNHDSAERLAFGAKLMSGEGIYLSPVFEGEIQPVMLQDEYGEIAVYMLPFVKPSIVRHAYPDARIESCHDAVAAVIERMEIKEDRRNVLIAHQFVTGAVRCESEEVSVGGVDNVDVELFEAFDYVALGHIHEPQKIGRETVRYCGTPLKYSFSEAAHKKAALIVTLGEKGSVTLEQIPLVPRRDMREIRGSYMEVTALEFYKDTNTDDYMHITLTDEDDIPDAIGKLRTIYPNIMRLDYDNKRTQLGVKIQEAEDVEKKTPMQLLKEFYEHQNNQPLTEEQEILMQEIMEKVWEDEL